MKIHERVAAIDIGSNAIRMVIAEYTPMGFAPLKRFRFPIRLGADVFEKGRISAKILKESARTFRKFKALTEKYGVKRIRAVGTPSSTGHLRLQHHQEGCETCAPPVQRVQRPAVGIRGIHARPVVPDHALGEKGQQGGEVRGGGQRELR